MVETIWIAGIGALGGSSRGISLLAICGLFHRELSDYRFAVGQYGLGSGDRRPVAEFI